MPSFFSRLFIAPLYITNHRYWILMNSYISANGCKVPAGRSNFESTHEILLKRIVCSKTLAQMKSIYEGPSNSIYFNGLARKRLS